MHIHILHPLELKPKEVILPPHRGNMITHMDCGSRCEDGYLLVVILTRVRQSGSDLLTFMSVCCDGVAKSGCEFVMLADESNGLFSSAFAASYHTSNKPLRRDPAG